MILPEAFVSAAMERRYTFFSGVPCSFLKPLINYVISNKELEYICAASEGEAVGIASGAHMAGKRAVVMCQNSGLGNMVNPLTSLCHPFRIPLLLIVTLRGEPGLNDEPQHELMGQITLNLLEMVGIPWEFMPVEVDKVNHVFDRIEASMTEREGPYALVMRKNSILAHGHVDRQLQPFVVVGEGRIQEDIRLPEAGHRPSRMECIKIIRDAASPTDAIVGTTGKIGRELHTLGDSDNQLYVVGSMGCASGIGFGIQRVLPKQRVIVLDGDGAALMKMGTMATIGHYSPPGLVHVILDNESYESTGGQMTVSRTVDFGTVAIACGYRAVLRVATGEQLRGALEKVLQQEGPSLIRIKVSTESDASLGRPVVTPYQVKRRFMCFLKDNESVAVP